MGTTNGVVPMGVVACNDYIYDAVMDSSPTGAVELFHGYTYSGIPVAVAAALAVQDIFEKEDIFERAKNLAPYFQKGLFSLQDLEAVDNIRGYGMMGGIDMKLNTKPGKAGYETFKACYEAGVNFKAKLILRLRELDYFHYLPMHDWFLFELQHHEVLYQPLLYQV